jgi:hypothetical protein
VQIIEPALLKVKFAYTLLAHIYVRSIIHQHEIELCLKGVTRGDEHTENPACGRRKRGRGVT